MLLRAVLATLVLSVLAVFGLALRLAAGPMEVSWLVHALTPLPIGHEAGGRPAGRLDVGRAWIGWPGSGGTGGPLSVRLEDVSVRRQGDVLADHVDRASFSLLPAPLLRGRFAPVDVALSGVRLHLRRDAGGVDLGLAPPGPPPRTSRGTAFDWNRLRHVQVADLSITVHDLLAGRDWGVEGVGIDVRPLASGGLGGTVQAALVLAGQRAALHAVGRPVGPTGDVDWRLDAEPVVPASLAAALPEVAALAPLRSVTVPVAPAVDIVFANGPDRFMQPLRATLDVGLGTGAIGLGASTLHVANGRIGIDGAVPRSGGDPAEIHLTRLDLQLRDAADGLGAAPTGPLLHAHGTLALDRLADARRIRGVLVADIPQVGFAGLAQYWPDGMINGARRWITANITDGTARNLHVETHLAGDRGWSSVDETDRSGGFDADGLTLWWLRPILPLREMQARLTFQGTDAVLIEASHAVMPVALPPDLSVAAPGHTIAVSDSLMRITGLNAKDQIATLKVRLVADLGDLLVELSHPRLRLLSQHPVSFTHPSGHTDTVVQVVLPLEDKVAISAIQVQAQSRMADVHLGDVAAGRALDGAQLTIAASVDGLTLDGSGLIGAMPATLAYRMDFRGGPPSQVTEDARVQAVITPDIVRREGLDPSDNVSGSGGLSVGYQARRDGTSSVSLALDMTALGVTTQVWSKRAGLPATADAMIGLKDGHLVSIDHLHAQGPGLMVEARADVEKGRAANVVVGRFELGRSRGVGRIDLPRAARQHDAPAAPIRVTVRGPVLDLSALFGTGQAGKPTPAAEAAHAAPGPAAPRKAKPDAQPNTAQSNAAQPWQADLTFDRVYVGHDTSFTGVKANLEDDGVRMQSARLAVSGPTAVTATLSPDTGGRRVTAQAADAGRLLQALGVTSGLSGGTLGLEARFDDRAAPAAGSPLSGQLEIGPFVVQDAPLAARIARNLSIYGWLTALPTPQLGVQQLVAPFTLRDNVLTLIDARAHSSALGVTLRGPIDLGHSTLDLRGTVVPAWAINQLPGRLPVVGRLLSPEKEGGVLAATLKISGPLGDPAVHVNALSALAPGFLRRLLFE